MRWVLDPIIKTSQNRHFDEIVIDQCAFGQPWHKRTWLLCYRIADARQLIRPLCMAPGGGCDFSSKPHIQLVGGKRTAPAAAYPKRLAEALAKALVSEANTKEYNT